MMNSSFGHRVTDVAGRDAFKGIPRAPREVAACGMSGTSLM
jgi:hypothetical protein